MGKVGIWMYQNGGGDRIEQKMVSLLEDLGHEVITRINLRHAVAESGKMIWNGMDLYELDCFFSYNAGEQTRYQVYLYGVLDRHCLLYTSPSPRD